MKKVMALGMLGVVGASVLAGAASAFGPSWAKDNTQLQTAIENNDYDSFITAVAEIDPDAATRISEDRFNHLVERHETKEAIDQAIENQDYNAWVAAVSATPHGENIAAVVSEDEFDDFIRMHELREEARGIASEIGLDEVRKGQGHGPMGKKGFGHGMRDQLNR